MPHMGLKVWPGRLIAHQLEQFLDVRQVQFSLVGPLIFPEGAVISSRLWPSAARPRPWKKGNQ